MPKFVDILAKPTALQRFKETTKTSEESSRAWFDRIFRLVEMDEPEKGEGPNAALLRAAEKFRFHIGNVNLTMITQLKEDDIARKRLIDTYESLTGLMSQVELPVPGKKRVA